MNLEGHSILIQTAAYVSFMQTVIWDFPSKFDLNQERAVPQTPSFVWSDCSKINSVEGGTPIQQ